MPANTRIAVLGAGSWGTALACHLARNGLETRLWGRNESQLEAMARERTNSRYLPDQRLPDTLHCSASFDESIEGADAVLIATPSQTFRQTLQRLINTAPLAPPVIWACKGVEKGSARLLSTLAKDVLDNDVPLAIISGPTFAKELMAGLPTAITVASESEAFATSVAAWLNSETFRAYRSDDIIGVQVGGALKNVFAIAAGISDGLGYGANARAALITRASAEIMRLGVAMGGRRETFMGLAGMGDLVLTCTDDLSRNRRMGLALARGLTVEAAREEIGQAVEGIGAALEAIRLASQFSVDMPISEQVHAVLYNNKSPDDAVRDLLRRQPREENP